MNLFDEIQNEILSESNLSTILRKAKVLAYKLKNIEFKDWIEHELNGYGKDDPLPDYRIISTESHGNFINSAWKITDVRIPITSLPKEWRNDINIVHLTQCVKEVEELTATLNSSKKDTLQLSWPAELLPFLNGRVYEYMNCMTAWRVITKSHLTGILENTRNRLLTFILELGERYPDEARTGFENAEKVIKDDQIRQVFNYYIMGGSHSIITSNNNTSKGGNMSIFDQRGQKVNYQYNAGNDINFGSVQNRVDLIGELEKLKAEVIKAGEADAIDAEIVTDVEYQMNKAIQHSKKTEPNKSTILDHLKEANKLIEGITSAAGIGTALMKAVELVQQLF